MTAFRVSTERQGASGFTLIELSIVLVIIGLIVGGVLVGQDLIRAAGVRATISQIEKYNTAVNTFRGKYGYLPGDIKDPDASNFGFAARGQYAGEGDGNGMIEGVYQDGAAQNFGFVESTGETVMFWVDLSKAALIEGGFTAASSHVTPNISIAGTLIDSYLPAAKLGKGNYIYAWSGGIQGGGVYGGNGINYFGLSSITNIIGCCGIVVSTPTLTVQEAYSTDKKVDDGFPQSGNVTAQYVSSNGGGVAAVYWAAGSGTSGASDASATPSSSTTCYDNGNVAGTQKYSLSQNNGAGLNCALSFRFQ